MVKINYPSIVRNHCAISLFLQIMIRYKYFLILAFCLLQFSCIQQELRDEGGQELIKYSENLSIRQFADHYKIIVSQPAKNDTAKFVYLASSNEVNQNSDQVQLINVPIESVVCLSTSHLPAFNLLDHADKIVGFPGTQWIYNSNLQANVHNGLLQDVGQKNGLNIEQIIELQPALIMAYSMGGNMSQLQPLQQAGIPVILNSDYLETSPLGRAEWIKLTGILCGQYQQADSIFSRIESAYVELRDLAGTAEKQPTVFTGLMYGDAWYVPAGESYAAKFITDAGGDYLWSAAKGTGSMQLSFETVLDRAKDASYWIGVASFSNYEELRNSNQKYRLFEAFQQESIYSYTKRVNESGANDYLESAYLRPDLVLADYIKMLHPQLLNDAEFTYFQPLVP